MMSPSGSSQVFFLSVSATDLSCVVIDTNAARFLRDVPSNLPVCGCSEREPSLNGVLHEILCKITANQADKGVMQSVTFVDGHTVTRVHHDVRRASRNVQDNLDRHVHGGHVERHEQESGRSSRGTATRRSHRSHHGQLTARSPTKCWPLVSTPRSGKLNPCINSCHLSLPLCPTTRVNHRDKVISSRDQHTSRSVPC